MAAASRARRRTSSEAWSDGMSRVSARECRRCWLWLVSCRVPGCIGARRRIRHGDTAGDDADRSGVVSVNLFISCRGHTSHRRCGQSSGERASARDTRATPTPTRQQATASNDDDEQERHAISLLRERAKNITSSGVCHSVLLRSLARYMERLGAARWSSDGSPLL